MDIKRCFDLISDKRNNPEIEKEFRETCSSYMSQCSASISPLSQDYQKCIDLYHRITSLYKFSRNPTISELIIYDTENEKEEIKILDTPNPLNSGTCITQLPNGELFCFGDGNQKFGTTLIIDENYLVRALPSGEPDGFTSGTYFNNSVYMFGGRNNKYNTIALSRKFDFNKNLWINLTPMPSSDFLCDSLLFNRNIVISRWFNANLLIYSTDIDSFSTIPYIFLCGMRKTLINAEKLYLIEWGGLISIYESEDEYNWEIISSYTIFHKADQSYYCSYNKGAIYITASLHDEYFKFDLNQKVMIRL